MTRYKELRRLERAIREKNKAELEWALSWCEMRLDLARRMQLSPKALKGNEKHWSKRITRLRSALDELQTG